VRADYINGYRLSIEFSDDHEQTVDFEPFLRRPLHHGISKYLDLELFRQFRIMDGQLDWNNYDMCFPLEALYEGKAPVLNSFTKCYVMPRTASRPLNRTRRICMHDVVFLKMVAFRIAVAALDDS
jgi:hypothetical protein